MTAPITNLEELIGKTIVGARAMKLKECDDAGFLRLEFSDGTHCTIEGSYDAYYTGESESEYPTVIELADSVREAALTAEKIIKIRPAPQLFGGAWEAYEAPGVAPIFSQPEAKEKALSYARNRFGGASGEIHVYDDAGTAVAEVFKISGGDITRPETRIEE